MKIPLRLLAACSAAAAVALLSGCIAVPADPNYGGYYGNGYGYDAYGYPVYAGSGVYYGGPAVVVAPPLSIGIYGSYSSGYLGSHFGGRRGPGWRGHGPGLRGPGWRGHGGGGYRGGFGGRHGGRGGGHR